MAKAVAMLVAVAFVVAAVSAGGASAEECAPGKLAPCLSAITSGAAPTAECCTNLSAQQGCFCQYARNPAYGNYITSPNAKRTLATCGIAVPSCS